MYSLASTKIFAQICYLSKFRDILGMFISQKNLVVAAKRCKVFKIFIPTKTIYSGPHISDLRRLAFRV